MEFQAVKKAERSTIITVWLGFAVFKADIPVWKNAGCWHVPDTGIGLQGCQRFGGNVFSPKYRSCAETESYDEDSQKTDLHIHTKGSVIFMTPQWESHLFSGYG